MKFSNNKKLKEYNRKELLSKLDNIIGEAKTYNIINHLLKLLEFNYTDTEIIELMNNYINSSNLFKTSHSKESYISFYGEAIGLKLYEEYKNHSSIALSIAGKKSYENGRKKCFEHFFPEYWINKGYSEEEAQDIVNKRKLKAKTKSIESLHTNSRITTTNIEYYLNKGLSEEDAKIALSERQATCSLKAFQKRYGKDEGLLRYKQRNEKWMQALNNKSDDEKERIYKERINGFAKAHINSISNEETKILDLLEKQFNIKIIRQFQIHYENKTYLFDGKYKNILIEFNGDYWHCNPTLYNESYYHTIQNKTAKEIWEYDDFKCNIVGKDYKKFIIWENELNDTSKIIERFRLYL